MIRVNDIGSVTLDIGDKCTHCGRETFAGSSLWIDRIPSYTDAESATEWLEDWERVDYLDGYLCRECLEVE
jgi:hypothetical protein